MTSSQMNIKQYREYLRSKEERRNKKKYRNDAKAKLGTQRFDSQLERNMAFILEEQKHRGEIKDYQKQVTIDFYALISKDYCPQVILLEKFERPHEPIKEWDKGKFVKITSYRIDFKIIHNDDSIEYLETKGKHLLTLGEWKIKWNLLSLFSDAKLTVVTDVGWGKKK